MNDKPPSNLSSVNEVEQHYDHQNPSERRLLIFSAWFSILLISDLPDIICNAIFGHVPAWFLWAKLGFLILFIGLCFIWQNLRPLWGFAFLMLVFYAGLSRLRSLVRIPSGPLKENIPLKKPGSITCIQVFAFNS